MHIGADGIETVKSAKCPYCGNNPVPHFLYWYFESFNILLAPVRRIFLHNFFSRFLRRRSENVNLSYFFAKLGKLVGIIKFRDSLDLCKVERAKVLWREAAFRNIRMEELLLFGRPIDTYIGEKGGRKIVFAGLPRPKNYDDRNLDLMDDKAFLKRLFVNNQLPVPKGGAAASFAEAKKIFSQIKQNALVLGESSPPVIVKPRAGSRGRHSTTYIYSEEEFYSAFKIAKKLCHWVMVEEQLSGPVYRATLINYELCGVLRGDPPQVVGDGACTIKQLIEEKNAAAHPKVSSIKADGSMAMFLSRQRLTFESVPQKGERVNLSEKVGVNYGGSSAEDYDICHPENKQLFIQAARAVADPIVGFDFIIPEISKSWKQQRCGFIEANSLPFINLHHDPLYGTPRNVAAKVWQLVGF